MVETHFLAFIFKKKSYKSNNINNFIHSGISKHFKDIKRKFFRFYRNVEPYICFDSKIK